MASRKTIDPRYLRILPKYLKLTPETKALAKPPTVLNASMNDYVAHFLEALAGPPLTCFVFPFDAGVKAALRQEQQQQTAAPAVKGESLGTYYYRKRTLEALQHIGLNIHGGMQKIHGLREVIRKTRKRGFSMSSVVVVDAEKARKYVDLGVRLDATTLLHDEATSLEQAVRNYAVILELMAPGDDNNGISDGDHETTVKKPGGETHDDFMWEQGCETFRRATKLRYRQVIEDVVLEEKVC
ncbi:hypothetical protein BDV95DRAFT_580235 [Massariosphaeria phaeospora]|uniref:Uncharacterized protein n=1 Tax=Massariosphaeria phaeospora TaxID=100035 RepID=A0A7C8I8V6_9PLEO|nr:hypothetical protein BDV95DRAFT_580235 [Massariosphaeria phaeospora]